MHLARLTGDPRVRAVAEAWRSLTAVAKIETHIEELCRASGLSDADFFGCVSATAWELGIDVAAFWMEGPGHAVSLRSALGDSLMREQPVEVLWPQSGWIRRRARLLARWNRRASDEAAKLRRRTRLSQSQFADLFMTTVRTVRRWEGGQCALTTHQQYFLRLFAMYIEWNGVCGFRQQFVREGARYGKAGRPPM
jgi:hypothetical protein